MTLFMWWGNLIELTPRVTPNGLNDVTKKIYNGTLENELKTKDALTVSNIILEWYRY